MILTFISFKLTYHQIISLDINYNWQADKLLIKDQSEKWKPYFTPYLNFSIFQNLKVKSVSDEIIQLNLTSTLKCRHFASDIAFSNISIKNFNLYDCGKVTHTYDKGLGLGYKFNDESYSFIHLLYKHHYIGNLKYSLEINDAKPKAIHFGGIPDNMQMQSKYKGYCDVNDDYSSWGCDLTNIIVNNKTYKFKSYTIFHTGFTHSILSEEMFDFFINVILGDYFKKGQCRLQNEEQLFNCNNTLMQNSNVVVDFVFGKMKISVPLKNFFFTGGFSFFERNKNKYYNKDGIIFGNSFLLFFNYIDINYETRQIGLFGDAFPTQMLEHNNYYVQKILYLTNFFICFIVISILIVNKGKLHSI